MFEKFGEYDNVDEFNDRARELISEPASLRILAKENGIDPEDVEDYMAGEMKDLADAASYALGRIKVELENTKIDRQAAEYIAAIARKVLTNGRKAHFKNRTFEAIMKAFKEKAKKNNQVYACGSDRDMEKIIEAYYFDSEKAMKKAVGI